MSLTLFSDVPRMTPTVQPNLMSHSQRLLVDIRQVRRLIRQRVPHHEKGNLYILLVEDLQHFLRQLRFAVINGEGECVGNLACEDEVTGR